MGHALLDAYHATGDEYHHQAAEQVSGALIRGRHPSDGWNCMVDFGGKGSIRRWHDTIGKNGWRSSSPTTATRLSTTPARRKPRSSSCGSVSRRSTPSTSRRSTERSISSSRASTRSEGPEARRRPQRRRLLADAAQGHEQPLPRRWLAHACTGRLLADPSRRRHRHLALHHRPAGDWHLDRHPRRLTPCARGSSCRRGTPCRAGRRGPARPRAAAARTELGPAEEKLGRRPP